jgi:hypothetical protein
MVIGGYKSEEKGFLEKIVGSVRGKVAAGMLGLGLALSPIYAGCGSECGKDAECKRDRICVDGECVSEGSGDDYNCESVCENKINVCCHQTNNWDKCAKDVADYRDSPEGEVYVHGSTYLEGCINRCENQWLENIRNAGLSEIQKKELLECWSNHCGSCPDYF